MELLAVVSIIAAFYVVLILIVVGVRALWRRHHRPVDVVQVAQRIVEDEWLRMING